MLGRIQQHPNEIKNAKQLRRQPQRKYDESQNDVADEKSCVIVVCGKKKNDTATAVGILKDTYVCPKT